jgi:hypothetical protein
MKRPHHVLFVLCLALSALPLLASDKSAPDLVGTPDLIVSDNLGQQWVVREERLEASFCSVQEGEVTPGLRKLIRFTVMTPNIGDADIFIGDPNVHFEANDGLYEFATCHNHFHFKNYTLYQLIDPRTNFVWRAAKRGFCMLDTDPNPANLGEAPGPHYYLSCGRIGVPGNQGISHGWADTYRFFLGGQYFVLDGGDGQPPVPAGDYTLRITVNPPYAPDKKGNCPRFKDPATGLCHQFEESNYANNVREVTVQIPDHPGRDGVGPLKDEKPLGFEPAEHDQ